MSKKSKIGVTSICDFYKYSLLLDFIALLAVMVTAFAMMFVWTIQFILLICWLFSCVGYSYCAVKIFAYQFHDKTNAVVEFFRSGFCFDCLGDYGFDGHPKNEDYPTVYEKPKPVVSAIKKYPSRFKVIIEELPCGESLDP
jgi:hypothetical protein